MNNNSAARQGFFDDMAADWDQISRHDPDKLRYIAGLLNLKKGMTVLDVGCGTGIMIPLLVTAVGLTGRIDAIDYSRRMIATAREKFRGDAYKHVNFICEAMENLDISNQYDVVLCYSCFPHFDDKTAAAKKLTAATKPGGIVAVAHSCSRKDINRMHNNPALPIHHDILPPITEMNSILLAAGVTPVFGRDDEDYYIAIAKKPL